MWEAVAVSHRSTPTYLPTYLPKVSRLFGFRVSGLRVFRVKNLEVLGFRAFCLGL